MFSALSRVGVRGFPDERKIPEEGKNAFSRKRVWGGVQLMRISLFPSLLAAPPKETGILGQHFRPFLKHLAGGIVLLGKFTASCFPSKANVTLLFLILLGFLPFNIQRSC